MTAYGGAGLRPGPNRPGLIAPIAGIGENILLRRNDKFTIYRVTELESILGGNAITRDFGAIAAGATLNSQSLQAQLEMEKGIEEGGNKDSEIGQFRIRVLDDIRLTVNQRRQDPRFVTKSVRTQVSLFSRIHDPCDHLSELFVLGDDFPFFDVGNPTDYALVTARVLFYGFRYAVTRGATYSDPVEARENYVGIVGEGF